MSSRESVDLDKTLRYDHADGFMDQASYEDEYFGDDNNTRSEILIEALLSCLEPVERTIVELVVIGGWTLRATASEINDLYPSKKGTTHDHHWVERRLQWAVRKMQEQLSAPTFAATIHGTDATLTPEIDLFTALSALNNAA